MVHDLLGQAYGALQHNRRRSTLTMLGMAWGIATVVLLLAYGAGFERAIWMAFSAWGSNTIGVFPGRTSLQAGGTKAGTEIRLKQEDAEFLSAEVPLIKRIAIAKAKSASVRYNNRVAQFGVNGVSSSMQRIRGMQTEEGRLFGPEDEMARRRVVVLGSDVRKKLFSGQPAVGESVRIDGISFDVIGVLNYRIQDDDENEASQLYLPFSVMSDLTDTLYLSNIMIEYEGSDNMKVAAAVRKSMAFHKQYDPKDKRAVWVIDIKDELKELRIITTGIKVLLTLIGMLTLGIGGVGLMNIMLVSVTQRTREIGVEKALGARKRHILAQFLAEALAITFAGGMAGVVIAYLISWSVGSLTLWSAFVENAAEGDIYLRIDPQILMVATCILAFVGIVSGMLPAIKAARLDPIEALRYE